MSESIHRELYIGSNSEDHKAINVATLNYRKYIVKKAIKRIFRLHKKNQSAYFYLLELGGNLLAAIVRPEGCIQKPYKSPLTA